MENALQGTETSVNYSDYGKPASSNDVDAITPRMTMLTQILAKFDSAWLQLLSTVESNWK